MEKQEGSGEPFDWTPPDELRRVVEKVIHSVTFDNTDVTLKDMHRMVYYRRSVISFDHALKPHEVHPAFWNAGMPRVYVISVLAARSHEKTWERCFNALYSKVLKPHNIQDVIVKFNNGSVEQLYGPHFVRIGDTLMEIKNGRCEEKILGARRSPHPAAPHNIFSFVNLWFENIGLYLIMGSLQATSLPEAILPETKAYIEDVLHRAFYFNRPSLPAGAVRYEYTELGWDDQARVNILEPNARNWYVKTIHFVIIRATHRDMGMWDIIFDRLDKDEIAYKFTYGGGYKIYSPTHIYHYAVIEHVRSYRLIKSFVRARRSDVRRALEEITEQSHKQRWDYLKDMERRINDCGARIEAERLRMHP
ncbi:hypothetical protein O1611_g6169 [Lasiodiplodia mahajangana]|uniref:Uncharacterized protein n=1 Tax=Lasiodiplodia mahajangana TaxID=1108764 RepID=A0ACC2JJ48_9PEZI|nr:hypothetical protein O1611_g6169 [Lasiodiplodia mahajangana]